MMAFKEGQNLEWKESWRDDHLRWVCGFADAEGGVLVIGRDDKGQVVRITNASRLLEELPNKIRDLLGIVVDVNLHSEAGAEYLEVVTPAYPSPISYRGHYFKRSGSTPQELKGAALDRFLLRKQGRTWDAVPTPGVTLKDLSGAAVRRFRALARSSGRVEPGTLGAPVADLIDKLRLREGAHLKRAALLRKHASLPYNPNVANAFFRAGEIEAWGRGIQRIFQACREAATPKPRVRLAGHDLWLVFDFSSDYLRAVRPAGGEPSTEADGKSSEKTQVETQVETRVRTPEKILAVLAARPQLTLAAVAVSVGKSVSAVERATAKLVKEGKVRFVGPRKGGHWEVLP